MQVNVNPITATYLASDSVTNAKLADNAVNTAEITASAVTVAKLANPNFYITFHHWISGNASAAADKNYWLVPVACTVTDVRAYANTAPTTQSLIVDVNKNGTTLFTTQGNRPTIAAAGNASTTTLPDVTSLAAGDRLSYDIDQVGSGTVGAGVSVVVTAKLNHVA